MRLPLLLLTCAAAAAAGARAPAPREAAAVDAGGRVAAPAHEELIARARRVRSVDPWAALALLEGALDGRGPGGAAAPPPSGRAARVALLEATAQSLSALKQPGRGVELRAEALALRKRSSRPALSRPMELVKALTAIAQDLRDDRRYNESLGAVHEAKELVRALPPTPAAAAAPAAAAPPPSGVRDAPALLAVLTRIEAGLLDCRGDTLLGLKRLAAAAQSGGPGDEAQAVASGTLLRHLGLLLRARSGADTTAAGRALLQPAAGGGDAPAARLRALLASQERKLRAELLARGPWQHPQQLPHTYVPGLAARAWHSVPAHWPRLAPVVSALEAAAPALAAEYAALRDAGRLEPEAECIHNSGAGGAWRVFMANAVWHRQRDTAGCSVHAPVACGLLARVAALRAPPVDGGGAAAGAAPPGGGGGGAPLLRPLRVGYSAVGGRSRLFPHHGVTNAQLKLHLGLVVPALGGGVYDDARAADPAAVPCAVLRVGNETRAWVQGRVLAFDDSFEHEVENRCDDERVVLQLVFAHPDLATSGSPDPFAGLAGSGGSH
jgi:hypothetical protein